MSFNTEMPEIQSADNKTNTVVIPTINDANENFSNSGNNSQLSKLQ